MNALTDAELLAHIDRFLERSGMTPTRFGLDAVGEGGFIKSLRDGRSVSLKIANRVLAFIAEQDALCAAAAASSPDNGSETIALRQAQDRAEARAA
jgi:hypothetical protein